MKRTWKTGLVVAGQVSSLALIGCGPADGLEGQAETEPGTSSAALTVKEQAAVNTANTSADCASLGDFYWEIGDGAAKRFGFSRGSTVAETTVLPLASSSKWLYASAYLQEKGYLNLTAAQKKRLNFTGGFIEGNDLNICGEPGTTVAVLHGRATRTSPTASSRTASSSTTAATCRSSPWMTWAGGRARASPASPTRAEQPSSAPGCPTATAPSPSPVGSGAARSTTASSSRTCSTRNTPCPCGSTRTTCPPTRAAPT